MRRIRANGRMGEYLIREWGGTSPSDRSRRRRNKVVPIRTVWVVAPGRHCQRPTDTTRTHSAGRNKNHLYCHTLSCGAVRTRRRSKRLRKEEEHKKCYKLLAQLIT
ncbi:hypothetical protein L596_001229 [Steinernema carpocapsae]|uniref:Uncharacterized protein n=1 Tax=Steinernema carpocapsae TaxID=34508 RepID=A0A4U8UMP9_STECR|nr:hypothetical protein L596_001229 [Steinernema carpocapsae]